MLRLIGLSLASGAGATDDDGDVVFFVVIEKAALLRSLAGGDDGEVGGAVGGGDDAGREMLGGVEVFDCGGLGEAEAGGRAGCFGVGREGGDAGGAGEERRAEGFDGVADGGDATQACDYNTVHAFSDVARVWVRWREAWRRRAFGRLRPCRLRF